MDCIFVTERIHDPVWDKVFKLQDILDKYEWVWLLDMDAFIVDFSKSIDQILDIAPKKDLSLIIANDYTDMVVNAGSFFIKNSRLIHDIIPEWIKYSQKKLPFKEQGALAKMITENYKGLKDHTIILPMRTFNSYCMEHSVDILKFRWGDFVIHFPGQLLEQVVKKMIQGDYVFLKPKSAAEPYYIARVLKIKDSQIQVNWFYRSRDLRGRGDSRELVASMDCDWNSINSIVRKVQVKHLSQIKDLKEFKQEDLCFYYDQLYDKYTRRMYQVVPLEQINNLPNQYKDLIKSEYLLIEEKSQKKFTQRRTCAQCLLWVNPTESHVVCSDCRRGFHLACVGLKKELPKKGYGWVCGLCTSKSHKNDDDECSDLTEFEDLEEDDLPQIEEEHTLKQANSSLEVEKWPWRYFGDYSRLEDLINDPEGRPKAASRIGSSYQAADLPVPFEEGSISNSMPQEHKDVEILKQVFVNKPRGRGRPRKSEIQESEVKKFQGIQGKKDKKKIEGHELMIPERGENEIVFSPKNIPLQELDDYCNRVHTHFKLSQLNAELMQKSLYSLHYFRYNAEEAFKDLSAKNLNDILRDEWALDDLLLFEKCFLEYGEDLSQFKEVLAHKSMKEIVSFFYQWRNTPRFISIFNQYTAKSRFKKKSEDLKLLVALSDLNSDGSSESETESIVNIPVEGTHCGVCKARKSTKWKIKYTPKKVLLCMECDIHWMQYGITPERDLSKKPEVEHNISSYQDIIANSRPSIKLETQDLNKYAQDVDQAHDTYVPDLEIECLPKEVPETDDEFNARPCAVCGENSTTDADNVMLVCIDCQLKVHRMCNGSGRNDDAFRCERCINIITPEYSINYSCVLCPKLAPDRLSVLKRTIGNNWAHLQCAIWIPEIKFDDPNLMDLVECIGHIDPKKWHAKTCAVCNSSDGVTIQCSERSCSSYMHASCALLDSEYLTMIGPMRGSDLPFEPMVVCKIHSRKWKNMVPTDKSQSQLLRQYVLQHKKAPVGLYTTGDKRAYSALLNDSCECHITTTIKIPKNNKVSNALLQSAVVNRVRKICSTCSNNVSPFWWPINPAFDADGRIDHPQKLLFECQKCKWSKNCDNINR